MSEKGRGLCPFCGRSDVYYVEHTERWRCAHCGKNFPSPSYGSWRFESQQGRLHPVSASQRRPVRSKGVPGWLVFLLICVILVIAGALVWPTIKGDVLGLIDNISSSLSVGPVEGDTTATAVNKPGTTNDIEIPETAVTETSEVDIKSELSFSESLLAYIYVLINQQRTDNELRALSPDHTLMSLAQEHSAEMAKYNYFSHQRTEGSRDLMWGVKLGYMRGENIIMMPERQIIPGPLMPADKMAVQAVVDWMESPGHRQNILTAEFTHSGIGVAYAGGYYYVTQIFEGLVYR